MDTESYSTLSRFSISYSMTRTPLRSVLSGSYHSKSPTYTSPSPSKLGFDEESEQSDHISDILDTMPPKKVTKDRLASESDDESRTGRTTRQSAQSKEKLLLVDTADNDPTEEKSKFDPLTTIQESTNSDDIMVDYDEDVDYEAEEQIEDQDMYRSKIQELEEELRYVYDEVEDQKKQYQDISNEMRLKVDELSKELIRKDTIITNLRKEIISRDKVIKSLSGKKLSVPLAKEGDIKGPNSIPLSIVASREALKPESVAEIELEQRDTRVLLQLALQRGLVMKPSYKNYLVKNAPKDVGEFRKQLCSFIKSHAKPKTGSNVTTPRKLLLKEYNESEDAQEQHVKIAVKKRDREEYSNDVNEEDECDKKPAAKRDKHSDD
jgi:hypothetical protein